MESIDCECGHRQKFMLEAKTPNLKFVREEVGDISANVCCFGVLSNMGLLSQEFSFVHTLLFLRIVAIIDFGNMIFRNKVASFCGYRYLV